MAFISALSVIWRRTIALSFRPRKRAGTRKSGRTATARRVRRHSSPNMITRALTSVMELVNTSTSVPLTARWAPMTSLFRREMSSPVLTPVKKRRDIRWRWAKSSVRRSQMMPSPTDEAR